MQCANYPQTELASVVNAPAACRVRFLNTFFHEIGHTLYANHASTLTWEYGDCSDPMGCMADRG
eukprot:359990-Chlamydomonas_euryale.AAC.9